MNQDLETDRLAEEKAAREESNSAGPASAGGFVALSRVVIDNGMEAGAKAAFRKRPHLVDGVPGYVRMDVLSPLARPEEIWILTYWTDAASFETWQHTHLYHESHQGIPKGLKLVPGETKI